jgi:SAM-dependent methyltransferase
MLPLRAVLQLPRMYQWFQEAGGFFGARLRFLRRSGLDLDGATVIDVGCGPGFMRRHLPASVQYFGFDTDPGYIDYAKNHDHGNATYLCQIFDASSVALTGPADVVMMNGLLHHLDDDTARSLIADAAACLKPGGCIVTLDGCYRPGQSRFRKKLLDWDRGEHVRTVAGYLDLFGGAGLQVSSIYDGGVSRVPYDFVWITAWK